MTAQILQAIPKADEQLKAESSAGAVTTLASGGNGGQITDMNMRLSKLEGAFGEAVQGLRHGQNVVLASQAVVVATVIGLAASMIVFGIYFLQRLDSISDRVNALPSQISAELRDVTKTLAESITAAKQQPPQIILMPQPQLPQPPPQPQPPSPPNIRR